MIRDRRIPDIIIVKFNSCRRILGFDPRIFNALGRIAAALTFGALGTEPVFLRLDQDKLIVSVLGNTSKKKELETIPLSTFEKAECSASMPAKFR